MSIRLSICLNPWVLDAKGKINNAQIWITKPKALKLKAAKLRLRQEAGATSQSWKVGFTLLLSAVQLDSCATVYGFELKLSKRTATYSA